MPEYEVTYRFKADTIEDLGVVLYGERSNWDRNPWDGLAELVAIEDPMEVDERECGVCGRPLTDEEGETDDHCAECAHSVESNS
jgi:thymidine kinase